MVWYKICTNMQNMILKTKIIRLEQTKAFDYIISRNKKRHAGSEIVRELITNRLIEVLLF